MPETQDLTIRELVSEAELGLVPLTGDTGLERVIRAVHHSDLADPNPWMTADTLLITHGNEIASSLEAGLEYLHRIRDKAAALVVGVGQHACMMHVRPQVVDHAQALGMPLLEAPNVPFRTIYAYVSNALTSHDMHRLRRVISVETHLLHLLTEGTGLGKMLGHLADIVDLVLILFSPKREVIAAAGWGERVDVERIWRAYDTAHGAPRPNGALYLESGRVCIREIRVHGKLERILVAVSLDSAITEFADMVLRYVGLLMELQLAGDCEQRLHHRRLRAALLRDFVACEESTTKHAERMRNQGVDLETPWRILVCKAEANAVSESATSASDDRKAYETRLAAAESIDEWFSSRDIAIMSAERGHTIISLLQTADIPKASIRATLVELIHDLKRKFPQWDFSMGLSGLKTDHDVPAAVFRQATESLRYAAQGLRVEDKVVIFDDVGARFRLVDGQSRETLEVLENRLMRPLVEYDTLHSTYLYVTLQAYLHNRLSSHEAAASLYVHRNTLHKRLRRIESLLKVDFGNIDDVMELYVALRAAELLADSKSEK